MVVDSQKGILLPTSIQQRGNVNSITLKNIHVSLCEILRGAIKRDLKIEAKRENYLNHAYAHIRLINIKSIFIGDCPDVELNVTCAMTLLNCKVGSIIDCKFGS